MLPVHSASGFCKNTLRLTLSVAIMAASTLWAQANREDKTKTLAVRPAPALPLDGFNEFLAETVDDTGIFVPRGAPGSGVQSGADHVVGQQCLDGGWGWPHASCPTTFHNITAPIALGLLQAYSITQDGDHLDSAVAGGDFDLLSVFPNSTPSFGSHTPAFMHALTSETGNSTYSYFAAMGFFDALTAGTYGDPTVDATYYPADTYDYIARHKSLRTGSLINLRPWDMQTMPWVAGLIGNSDSAPSDGVSQQTTFLNDSILDGINTLVAPLDYDLLGLAGGIRALALNGTTSFPAISNASWPAIDGETDLCDLVSVLLSYQNDDGSWSWKSELQNVDGEQDTQTTAYAVLALVAADVFCTDYSADIAAGRDWMWTMQDVDGGFFSYPGGDHNVEVEGEVLLAMSGGRLVLEANDCQLDSDPSAGYQVEVELWMRDLAQNASGFQAFVEYDGGVLEYRGDLSTYTSSPFSLHISSISQTDDGLLELDGSDAFGGTGTSAESLLATLVFDVITPCSSAIVAFEVGGTFPSELSYLGIPLVTGLTNTGPFMEDETSPVVTCPLDITVECDESTDPSVTGMPGHFQGFEDPNYVSNTTNDWNDYFSSLARVTSGTDGITSKSGAAHAVIDSTLLPTPPDDFTGAFTRLGGYDSTFGDGFTTSLDVYMNLSDPAVIADTYGWDLSTAANDQSGNHRRDFIFHSASNSVGEILVGGSNNSNFTRRNDLASINHYTITTSGWYTFQWVFRDAGDGTLAVDLNLLDASGTWLWTETRNDLSDVIATVVGGHRYMWFTFLEVNTLAIDNTRYLDSDGCDPLPDVTYSDVASLTGCNGTGTIARTWFVEDDCGNIGSCVQTITVDDDTDPVITCPADVTLECDEPVGPSTVFGDTGASTGGISIYYNATGPADLSNAAYIRTQVSLSNTNGAEYFFDTTPLTGTPGVDWASIFSGIAPLTQFGLDMVRPLSTDDGSVTIPTLTAVDNVDSTPGGATPAGTVSWAFNDYKPNAPNGPVNATNAPTNSIIRGPAGGDPMVDIEILQLELTGPTLTFVGRLDADASIHWFTPSTPDSPLANFGLTGDFYVYGTLSHAASGAGVDHYEGSLTVIANALTATGLATATDNCTVFPLVTFSDAPSLAGCDGTGTITRTWTAMDDCGNDASCVQVITVEDTTAPDIDSAPDVQVNADAGGCTAEVTFATPSATDNCDGTPTVTCLPASGSSFPTGTTEVTCTATDDCGNSADTTFDVIVDAVNDLDVEVELAGVMNDALPLTRCIHFVLDDCGVTADAVMTFVDHDSNTATPLRASGIVEIPCGDWTTICAKDEQHTLFDSTTLTDLGTGYATDALLSLTGGDTDNDSDIDINDVTWLIATFGDLAATGGCPYDGSTRDADFSNNGAVGSEDYTFLTANWLSLTICNCALSLDGPDSPKQPAWESVLHLSESDLTGLAATADLNYDSVVDHRDVRLFESQHGLPHDLSNLLREATDETEKRVARPRG